MEFAATARNTKAGIVMTSGKASFATLKDKERSKPVRSPPTPTSTSCGELGPCGLTGIQLAGKLHSDVQWQRGPGNAFTAAADASVQDFSSPPQIFCPGKSRTCNSMPKPKDRPIRRASNKSRRPISRSSRARTNSWPNCKNGDRHLPDRHYPVLA